MDWQDAIDERDSYNECLARTINYVVRLYNGTSSTFDIYINAIKDIMKKRYNLNVSRESDKELKRLVEDEIFLGQVI